MNRRSPTNEIPGIYRSVRLHPHSTLGFPAAAVNCGTSADNLGTDYAGTHACGGQDSFVKRVTWRVYWRDGYSAYVYVLDQGRSRYWTEILQHCEGCYPEFDAPFFEQVGNTATFVEITRAGVVNSNGTACTVGNTNWRHQFSHLQLYYGKLHWLYQTGI